jgi:hypothetical protein
MFTVLGRCVLGRAVAEALQTFAPRLAVLFAAREQGRAVTVVPNGTRSARGRALFSWQHWVPALSIKRYRTARERAKSEQVGFLVAKPRIS